MAGKQTDDAARIRRYVLRLLRGGAISIQDAAYIASVDRATVWRWCAADGLDVDAARMRRLVALREAAERRKDGQGARSEPERNHTPRTGPSRAQLQRTADQANKVFRSRSKKMRDPC